jgi:FAD-dependent urate hydroxylase
MPSLPTAIEGAIELARCLRDLPYKEAFAAYEGLRRGRVTHIIKLAARTNSHKAAGPIARRLRDGIVPLAMNWPNRRRQPGSTTITLTGRHW